MAILFNDANDYIVCECGHKTFTEQKQYAYKKETGRMGTIVKRKLVSKVLICVLCGTKQKLDPKQKVEDE